MTQCLVAVEIQSIGSVNTECGFMEKPDMIEILQHAWESSGLILSILMHGELAAPGLTTMSCY
jgi:hypothetical protein